MARIQSSVSPQTPNPLTVAMVHTGYLKFATERNIVPNRNAAHHEKARATLLVDRNQGVNAWNSKGGTRMADDESCIDFAGPARSPGMAAQLHRDAQGCTVGGSAAATVASRTREGVWNGSVPIQISARCSDWS